jgi:hypothetical protein
LCCKSPSMYRLLLGKASFRRTHPNSSPS